MSNILEDLAKDKGFCVSPQLGTLIGINELIKFIDIKNALKEKADALWVEITSPSFPRYQLRYITTSGQLVNCRMSNFKIVDYHYSDVLEFYSASRFMEYVRRRFVIGWVNVESETKLGDDFIVTPDALVARSRPINE